MPLTTSSNVTMRPVDAIEALLPQTQCGECGYPGCRPYAEALAQDAAPIDRCPPGGLATLKALGQFLGKDSKPFETPMQQRQRAPALASIREEECIGCTKCIQACPVDAIIGSAKHMHSIIRHECTGCGLCVEPCPVDCIDLLDLKQEGYDRNEAKAHHEARQNRLLKEKQALEAAYQQKRHLAKQSEDAKGDREAKNNYILKAMARVKAKKHE